jgi:tellurite resistance protein TehA-like permease
VGAEAAGQWIPPLLAAEVRNPAGWHYRSSRWSFVFPLGMYAVATQTLGRVAHLGPLDDLARVFFAGALLAWAVVLVGLARVALGSRV